MALWAVYSGVVYPERGLDGAGALDGHNVLTSLVGKGVSGGRSEQDPGNQGAQGSGLFGQHLRMVPRLVTLTEEQGDYSL